MSGWTAILLAALVTARAPKGTFSGAGDASAAAPAAPAAVTETRGPAAEGGAVATSTVASAAASTGTVAGVAATGDAGKAAVAEGAEKKTRAPTEEEKLREEEKARQQRLTEFWRKTPHYFIGTYGILSVVGMLLAVFWLVRYARRSERSVYYFRALLVTLGALVLADWTYFDISQRLDVDRTAQEAAGRAWQEEVKAKELKEVKEATTVGERVEQMRFAEESDADRKQLKEAGQKGESQKDELDKALEAVQTPPPEDNEPEYRKRGRQKRAASTNKTEVVNASAALGEVSQEKPWRVMSETDMFRATAYGRLLLLLSQIACWLAFATFLLDYFLRFNLTFDYFFPLPLSLIGGDRFIEMLLLRSKTLTTLCRGIPREKLEPYLNDLIRKGETFVYFGERDPLPDRDRLHRFSFGRLHLLPVKKFVCSSDKPWDGSEFVLESCWFSRGCFVVEGLPVVERLRDDMQEFLHLRQLSRAWARRTVHFVWDHPSPPHPALLDDMLACGRNTNLKVVVLSPAFAGTQAAPMFQETYETFPDPRPSPVLLERLTRGGLADTVSWVLASSWTVLVNSLRAAWPRVRRAPGYLWRAVVALWGAVCIVAVGIGRGTRWAWPAVRGVGRFVWMAVRFVGRAAWKVVSVLGRGSKGAGGMFGKLMAWSKERKEKKAAEKAKRDAEWKRLLDAKKIAEEKKMQATAAKVAAAKEEKAKAEADKAAEKAALPGAGALVKKPEAASSVPQSKAALAERLKAKQAERAAAAGGKKVDLAQILKAKQAAAQSKAAGPLAKPDEQKPATGQDASTAPAPGAAKDAEVAPQAKSPVQPPVEATAPVVAPPTVAKSDEPAAKQADDKAALEARIRAEVEDRLRKEREDKELQAKLKADEEARKVREAAEKARQERETAENLAKEKSEREARERKGQEARVAVEVADQDLKVREEAERQARAKAEEEAKRAREQAEAAEKARLEREAAERLAKEKAEREARERAEAEARLRAEIEERIRKESEEAERLARVKAEEEARKAREQAEAAEKARLEREAAERLAKEKAEREARERAEAEARLRAEIEERIRKEKEEAERLARVKAEEEVRKVEAAPRVTAAPPPAPAPSADATKPDTPAAGGKRIIIVKKPGQVPAKPPVAAAPGPQIPPAPVSAAKAPAAVPAPPPMPEPPAPADMPEPVEQDENDVTAGSAEGAEASPRVRSEPIPPPAAPRDGKRIVVMKKHASGSVRPQAAEPKPAPSAPLPRAPVPPVASEGEEPADEIRFHCPHCGQHLAAPPQLAGRQLPCTHCKNPIVVPGPAGQPGPNAVPASSSTIMATPMPPTAAPQVRVSFVPPRPMPQSGRVRPPVFGASEQPQQSQPQPQPQPDSQFKFFCPFCGQKLAAKREWVGKSLKCPACQRPVVIPAPK